MANATAAWHEAKLLSFFLPINDFKELFAVNTILASITDRFGGFTRSSMEKGSKMKGRYKSDRPEGHIDDWVVQVLVIARGVESAVKQQLAELHAEVHAEYAAQESPQEGVWMLAQDAPLFADLS